MCEPKPPMRPENKKMYEKSDADKLFEKITYILVIVVGVVYVLLVILKFLSR